MLSRRKDPVSPLQTQSVYVVQGDHSLSILRLI
jgi:hypothetical protein